MTEANEFRWYAKEAPQCASESKDEKEKLSFIDLADTWAQAAIASQTTLDQVLFRRGGDAD
jgi:hypothetical protein